MRRFLCLILLAGCASATPPSAPEDGIAPPAPVVVSQWNHRAEADSWNAAMMQALLTDGRAMLDMDLADAAEFCPAYESATPTERAAFFVAFFSGLARFESTWNPRAAGAGGRYRGLLQISPRTAEWQGCTLGEDGLYDGATNLRCAVRIANAAVVRDGVVASGRRGIAADWPPMRNAQKRASVAQFTRSLDVCQS